MDYDVIMELLGDTGCSSPEFSATTAGGCDAWSPATLADFSAHLSSSSPDNGPATTKLSCLLEPTADRFHSTPQPPPPQQPQPPQASDDLIGLNTWDFAVMRSEFGDLQAIDSAALIDLYRPAAVPTAASDVIDLPELEEEAQRCRSDSGYSSSTAGAGGGHQPWWRCGGSPCGSSSSTSATPPLVPSLAAHRRARHSGGVAKRPAVAKKARSKPAKSRQLQLWQFLYHLLPGGSDAGQQPGQAAPLRWESRQEGSFRIVNPTALADAWGRHRRRDNMTYEKMSRTLRYYYDRKLITKVAGKQHTYRFHYDQFPAATAE